MAVEGMSGKDAYIEKPNLTTKTAIKGKSANEMDMNDFLNLLVAQMTNQDMLNPSNDTEFIAQMAQFSSLQGIKTIQEYQLSSYAAGYVGKTVSIAHVNEAGNMTKTEGVVTSITFYSGEPKVVVNNVSYPLYSVMEVKVPKEDTGSGSGSNTGTGSVGDKDKDKDDKDKNTTDPDAGAKNQEKDNQTKRKSSQVLRG